MQSARENFEATPTIHLATPISKSLEAFLCFCRGKDLTIVNFLDYLGNIITVGNGIGRGIGGCYLP